MRDNVPAITQCNAPVHSVCMHTTNKSKKLKPKLDRTLSISSGKIVKFFLAMKFDKSRSLSKIDIDNTVGSTAKKR